jgi:hypothetical protein
MPVIPAVAANINRRIAISEITRVERAGDMAQVVEDLPDEHEASSSNLST